jgi:hypothetical protein
MNRDRTELINFSSTNYEQTNLKPYGVQVNQIKNMKTYYRVFDTQRGDYFATGYNAESMQELISDFQSYILMANEVDDNEENKDGFLSNWEGIAEYLQGAELEESNTPFEEQEY